jgi:hypothetical protein
MRGPRRPFTHCAYCSAPSISIDHVPPRSIFTGERTNLITVPACHDHNGGRSDLDERFRNYVSMRVGTTSPATQALWSKVLRGIGRNRKLKEKIRGNMLWRADLNRFVIKVDTNAFKPAIEWITRGLYWHEYQGGRLPFHIEMKIAEMRIGDWLPGFVSDMGRRRVGGDQFFYACKRMDEHPTASIWVYVFHRRLVAMVMTDVSLMDDLIAEETGGNEASG